MRPEVAVGRVARWASPLEDATKLRRCNETRQRRRRSHAPGFGNVPRAKTEPDSLSESDSRVSRRPRQLETREPGSTTPNQVQWAGQLDGRAGCCDETQLGHVGELADIPRHLEERV